MKNYSQFITELNKFETMLKLGKSVGRFTGLGKTPLKKDMIIKMRNHPNNMFLSPRRSAENVLRDFQKTQMGEKGANIMKSMSGKYVNYNPTATRQLSGTGLRGQTKKRDRFLDKILKDRGDKTTRNFLRNKGDATRQLYNPPQPITRSDKMIGDMIGGRTTTGKTTTFDVDYFKNVPDTVERKLLSKLRKARKKDGGSA